MNGDDGIDENQVYKWFLTGWLLASLIYFLYSALKNKIMMDLLSFGFMLITTNVYFFSREIEMINWLESEKAKQEDYPLA